MNACVVVDCPDPVTGTLEGMTWIAGDGPDDDGHWVTGTIHVCDRHARLFRHRVER